MQVQLLLADRCDSCQQVESMWRFLCAEYAWDYQVLDIQRDPAARALVENLRLVTFPALLVDGEVKVVGSYDKLEARAMAAIWAENEPKL